MKALREKLIAFIIHYSPLFRRLQIQQSVSTWNLLYPIVITENCTDSAKQHFPYFGSLNANIKAEAMAQTSCISDILSYHAESIKSGQTTIQALSRDEKFSANQRIYTSFYHQAISAYSTKNYELTLQHIQAIMLFLQTERKYCLILEDDSIPIFASVQSLKNELEYCLQQINKFNSGYFDISDSLGFTPNHSINITDCKYDFTMMGSGQTRCASAYILTRPTAYKLLNQQIPIVLPIDWHLSYLLRMSDSPTYWRNIPIFSQGSQTGQFKSNQNARNINDPELSIQHD